MDYWCGSCVITSFLRREKRECQSHRRRCDYGSSGQRERRRFEDATLLALKMEIRVMCQGMQWPLEAGKDKKMDALLEPPGGTQHC